MFPQAFDSHGFYNFFALVFTLILYFCTLLDLDSKTTWLPLIFNFNINLFAWVFESQIKQ